MRGTKLYVIEWCGIWRDSINDRGKCQSNESKFLSIETRRTVYHLGSVLGTPLSLRLRKLINPLIPPPTTLSLLASSFPPPALNRLPSIHRMTSTRHESRGESVGSFPSIPRTPLRSSGFRTKWHSLSSCARSLLCFHQCKNNWPRNSKVVLHTPARSKSTMSQPSPRIITAPWNVARSRSCQVHTAKVAKQEGREVLGDDKMTAMTTLKESSPPESKPSSQATASVYAPVVEESGALRPILANGLYDDHVATPPQFNETETRSVGTEQKHRIATGDTIDALIDALLQFEGSEEWGSMARPGTSLLDIEAAIDDKSMVCGMGAGAGVGEEEKKKKTKTKTRSHSASAWEEADAKRAWEDMKRRVMHIEEFGALPPPEDAGDAEREFRARRRKHWAEKATRGHYAREEGSRRVAAKKRRRNAGCWVREDGVFMRLVRDICYLVMSFSFFVLGSLAFARVSQYSRRM